MIYLIAFQNQRRPRSSRLSRVVDLEVDINRVKIHLSLDCFLITMEDVIDNFIDVIMVIIAFGIIMEVIGIIMVEDVIGIINFEGDGINY